MAEDNDINTTQNDGVVASVEQSAEQVQAGANDVVDNATQLYDEIRHLPQTIKEGVTEAYRQAAAPYRQNLTGDITDMVTISEKTTTVKHTSIAQVRESVPQMFDDFINQNYTEDQQQAIRTEMSQQLADNNGTCTFVWKDSEQKDSVTAVYEDNQLQKFRLYNVDITEDNYQTQELRFHMKKDSDEAFTLISETRDKVQTTVGKVTHKTIDKVKVDEDGDYVSKSSQSDKIVSSTLGQFSISGTKLTSKEKGDDEGINSIRTTTTQYNVELGTLALGANVRGASQNKLYDDEGQVVQETMNANGVTISTHGLDVAHQDSNKLYNDDGTVVINRNEVRASLHAQSLAVKGKVEHQNTVTDANGQVISDTRLMAQATVGYGAFGAGVEAQTLRTDDEGNKVAHHNAIGGEVSHTGLRANFAQNTTIVDDSGITTYQNSTQAALVADRAGSSFTASQLKDVKDEDGKTLLHKELSAQTNIGAGGVNVNLNSSLQTETTNVQKSFVAAVDSRARNASLAIDNTRSQVDGNGQITVSERHLNSDVDAKKLTANAKSVVTQDGEEVKKFDASADVKSAQVAYNDKTINPQVLIAQVQRE